jgi:hypothetical protein
LNELSSTKTQAAIQSAGVERIQAELAALVAARADADGGVRAPFQTELFLAVKGPSG